MYGETPVWSGDTPVSGETPTCMVWRHPYGLERHLCLQRHVYSLKRHLYGLETHLCVWRLWHWQNSRCSQYMGTRGWPEKGVGVTDKLDEIDRPNLQTTEAGLRWNDCLRRDRWGSKMERKGCWQEVMERINKTSGSIILYQTSPLLILA